MRLFISSLLVIMIAMSSLSAQPKDLCIGFDTSGSILFELLPGGSNVEGTCADMLDPGPVVHALTTRYRIALSALSDISVLLAQFADPVITGVPNPIGQVHVVRFPNVNIAPTDAFTATASDPFSKTANPGEIFDYLVENLDINCTVFGTPLAAGLRQSNDLLTSCTSGTAGTATGPGPDKMILLISDGQPTDGFSPFTDTAINTELGASVCDDVQINAIGIGNWASSSYFDFLHKVATRRRGHFFGYVPSVTTPVGWGGNKVDNFASKIQILTQLEGIFVSTLGYTAISDPIVSLQPGEEETQTFTITELDTNLIFALHWKPDRRQNIRSKITTPNGQEITDTMADVPGSFTVRKVPGSTYYMFVKNFIESGDWSLSLRASENNRANVRAFFSLYTRSTLGLATEFARRVFGTGDFFAGDTQVSYQGSPLRNLVIKVAYKAPTNWRGNFNADQKLSAKELEVIRLGRLNADGSRTPWLSNIPLVDRKFIYLQQTKSKRFLETFQSEAEEESLFDDGSAEHDDRQANDGIYNNKFLELRKPGLHQILYKISGTTPAGLPFQRELYFHKYVDVTVQPNWNHSEIDFKPLPKFENQKAARITVKFKDKYGNVPLPADSGAVVIKPDERGQTIGTLVNNLDGTYIQDITYDQSLDRPTISTNYGGINLPNRKIIFIPNRQFTPQVKYVYFDDSLGFSTTPVLGVSFDHFIKQKWVFNIDFGIGRPEDASGNRGNLLVSSMNLKLNLRRNEFFRPYILAGVGYLRFEGFSVDDQAFGIDIGLGVDYSFSPEVGIRFEVRDKLGFDLYNQDTTHNFLIGGGMTLNFF